MKSVDIPVTAKICIWLLPVGNVASRIVRTVRNCLSKIVEIHARFASQRHSCVHNSKLFDDACKGIREFQ